MYSLFSPILFRTFINRNVDNNINKIFPITLRSDCLKVVVLHSNRSVSSLYLNEYEVGCHLTPYKIFNFDNKKLLLKQNMFTVNNKILHTCAEVF